MIFQKGLNILRFGAIMIETHCQDSLGAAAFPKEKHNGRGQRGTIAGCKEERILFMDEIKVVPYIPDEDYDNPAMVEIGRAHV